MFRVQGLGLGCSPKVLAHTLVSPHFGLRSPGSIKPHRSVPCLHFLDLLLYSAQANHVLKSHMDRV